MIWLHPAAWLGLVAVAAPLLVHLLVHKRAEPLAFPTLRFLQPTRLASIRRHLVEEVPLLLVRAAILALAAAAAAGPLLTGAFRRAMWNGRVARAVVTTGANAEEARHDIAGAFRGTIVTTAKPAEGLRRAAAWLAEAPPAKREIVIRSPFPIASLTDVDIAGVPSDVGLRFVPSGVVPRHVDVTAGASLGASRAAGRAERHVVSAALDEDRTSVTDVASGEAPLPISIAAPPDAHDAMAAALAAVLSGRVPAPDAGRSARLILLRSDAYAAIGATVRPIRDASMADSVAVIARDEDLAVAARLVATGLDDRFDRPPWQALARAADGRPMAAAASDGALVVVSAAPASHRATPLLLRALFDSLAPSGAAPAAEVLAIPDATLRGWQRPARDVAAPDLRRVEQDDRRWLWGAVLALLTVETLMRRRKKESDPVTEINPDEQRTAARVA